MPCPKGGEDYNICFGALQRHVFYSETILLLWVQAASASSVSPSNHWHVRLAAWADMQMLVWNTLSRMSWSVASLTMSWHQKGCACTDGCTDHCRADVGEIANNDWADGHNKRRAVFIFGIYQWLFQPGGTHLGPGLGLSEIYVMCFGPWAMCDGSLVASCSHITLRWHSPQPVDRLQGVWSLWYWVKSWEPHWKRVCAFCIVLFILCPWMPFNRNMVFHELCVSVFFVCVCVCRPQFAWIFMYISRYNFQV